MYSPHTTSLLLNIIEWDLKNSLVHQRHTASYTLLGRPPDVREVASTDKNGMRAQQNMGMAT